MKSIRVRPDYSVELPEEIRSAIHPGDALEVSITAGNVVYLRPKGKKRDLKKIIKRVRSNPPDKIPSNEEIEDIVHQVRRERQ